MAEITAKRIDDFERQLKMVLRDWEQAVVGLLTKKDDGFQESLDKFRRIHQLSDSIIVMAEGTLNESDIAVEKPHVVEAIGQLVEATRDLRRGVHQADATKESLVEALTELQNLTGQLINEVK